MAMTSRGLDDFAMSSEGLVKPDGSLVGIALAPIEGGNTGGSDTSSAESTPANELEDADDEDIVFINKVPYYRHPATGDLTDMDTGEILPADCYDLDAYVPIRFDELPWG